MARKRLGPFTFEMPTVRITDEGLRVEVSVTPDPVRGTQLGTIQVPLEVPIPGLRKGAAHAGNSLRALGALVGLIKGRKR